MKITKQNPGKFKSYPITITVESKEDEDAVKDVADTIENYCDEDDDPNTCHFGYLLRQAMKT